MPSLGNFDPNQHQDSFEPMPAGDYLVMITESTIDVKQDGGQQVKITMEVMQPEQYYGRKAFANFTLEHSNPKAVEVGRRILANLCRAVGVMSPRETEELHGIPFWVRLSVETWNDGSLHNDSRAFWSTQAQAPPQAKSKGKPAQQAMGSPQYQQPRPGPAQQWQQPAQPPRPQAPAPQAYGPPGGQPWQPAPQGQPMHPQPPQPAYQPPQATHGQPPWAQQPQGQPPARDHYYDGQDETPF